MSAPVGHERQRGRRADLLKLLQKSGDPLTVAEIARRLGVHANTARFHLDTLVEAGRIERMTGEHRGPGRPPQLYAATRTMDPSGPRSYQILAEVLTDLLADDPAPAARAVRAGYSWGSQQAEVTSSTAREPVGRLVHLLDTIGFAPERPVHDTAAPISLRHCPFLELATAHREVICPIHLGMMQGALDTWGSDRTVNRLDPLVEPDRCLAHLGPADGR